MKDFRVLFRHMRDHGPLLWQFDTSRLRSTDDPLDFIARLRRIAFARDCAPSPVSLALALLACSSNVPWRVYHLYAVFLHEDTPDDEAERIFLDSIDPADPARRDWAARWLIASPPAGSLVSDFYAYFHALLDEASLGRADELEKTWPIKLVFSERVLHRLNTKSAALTKILWNQSGTVAGMSAALSDTVFPKEKLRPDFANWRRGCWFCHRFAKLCPPSAREHPGDLCPLLMHPRPLAEVIVDAMRLVGIDWLQYKRAAKRDELALDQVLTWLEELTRYTPTIQAAKSAIAALLQLVKRIQVRMLSMVIPVLDRAWIEE
ncbi:hypothetical protein H9P43_006800 [Blastocladiella emersonii ATCC 22665]|nr:hypothetical protein H9P43_006800 [Blastocladiella emersonii ATCC 22665]